TRNRKLTAREQKSNRTKSKVRVRVEHVFGAQTQKAGNLLVRTVGLARATVKIGMRNLAYNMDRLGTLLVT
ncbi:transposase, partial [Desulfogranum marinum]